MHQQELDIVAPKIVQNAITGKYAIQYFKRGTNRQIISSLEFVEYEDADKVVKNILNKNVAGIPYNFQ